MDVAEIIDEAEIVDETFDAGTLRERTITGTRFDGCTFTGIDASMVNLVDCTLADCRFVDVKLVGINLTRIRPSLQTAISFENCQLDYAVMSGMDLRGSRFINCRMLEASFEGTDLRNAVFHHSVLSGAVFTGADLRGADLAGATGYHLDPRATRVKGLRVSMPDAEVFLTGLGLDVVPYPDDSVGKDRLRP